MSTFEETLERIKKATGARTQVDLANILGIRQSSISDAKKRNSVPADWFLKLYRGFGLNPDWLSDGIEPVHLKSGMPERPAFLENLPTYGQPRQQARMVPVSAIRKTDPAESGSGWMAEHAGEIAIPDSLYRQNLIVVRAESAGMEPLIRKNAWVGLDADQKRPMSGEIYGVFLPFEGLALKRLFLDADNSRFLLRSENRDHPDMTVPADAVESLIIGRVCWVLQEM